MSSKPKAKQVSIDYSLLIDLVKARPILYHPLSKSYHNQQIKWSIWQEVGAKLEKDWCLYDKEEKKRRVRSIQKCWQNIRHNYEREYMLQEKMKHDNTTNKPPSNRKPMVHYHKMAFMNNAINATRNMSRSPRLRTDKEVSHTELSLETNKPIPAPQKSCLKPTTPQPPSKLLNRRKSVPNRLPSDKETSTFNPIIAHSYSLAPKRVCTNPQMPLLNSQVDNRIEEHNNRNKNLIQNDCKDIDDDQAFLVSLLPSMKRLDEDQKLLLRILILNAVRQVNLGQSPEVLAFPITGREEVENDVCHNGRENEREEWALAISDDISMDIKEELIIEED